MDTEFTVDDCGENSPLITTSKAIVTETSSYSPDCIPATIQSDQRKCFSLPVEIILVLYFVSAMMLVPVEQLYVFKRTSDDQNTSVTSDNQTSDTGQADQCPNGNNSSVQSGSKAQALSAKWLLLLTLSENFCAMISTCLLAAIIDTKGRKFGLLIPLFGTLSKVFVFMAVVWFKLPLIVLLAADVIEGSSGYYATVMSAALAHLADRTRSTRSRSHRITLALAINGICIGLTYLIAGFIIDVYGFFYPLIVSLLVLIVAIPLTIFTLPETLNKDKTTDALNMSKLFSTFVVYAKSTTKGRRWKLICLASALFTFNLVVTGRGSVQSLYQLSAPFCWTATEIGYFGAAQTIGHQFVTLVFFPPLRVCVSEIPLAILGALSSMASCLLQAFANNGLMMYMVTVVGAFQMFVPPTIKTVMSSVVESREQGAVFASLGILQMVCSCVAQVILNSVYAATLTSYPGAVFLLMAASFVITTILLSVTYTGIKLQL